MSIRIVFSIVLSFIYGLMFSQCPTDIRLTDQSEIDKFKSNYPGCSTISGTLEIQGKEIMSLDSLSSITHVGSLYIYDTELLSSLSGLENISIIDNDFRLASNKNLTDLTGLQKLVSIKGVTYIFYNDRLKNFVGLDNLNSVDDIFISNNQSLVSFLGLQKLQTINGGLNIYQNEQLTNLDGLNFVNEIGKNSGGGLLIKDCPNLVSLHGLEQLSYIENDLTISINRQLVNLDGFLNLKEVGWSASITISENETLDNLNGLQSLKSARDLVVEYNNSLTTVSGLRGIIEAENISIGNNSLININGLDIFKISGSFSVLNNPKLQQFNSMHSLLEIGNLAIGGSPLLTQFNGFEKLKKINSELTIAGF